MLNPLSHNCELLKITGAKLAESFNIPDYNHTDTCGTAYLVPGVDLDAGAIKAWFLLTVV